MVTASRFHKYAFVSWLIVFVLATGCAGRKVTTGVEDQTFLPGPAPTAVVELTSDGPPPAEIQKPPTVTTPGEGELVTEQPVPIPSEREAPTPAQPMRELADIFFDFDRYAIRSDAQSELEGNAAILMAQPTRTVVIEGHCDERGTSRYLQDLGVAASQIQITSYGKERPFCIEHSEACWQSNRRAHFRLP